jgi:hypothetical protein
MEDVSIGLTPALTGSVILSQTVLYLLTIPVRLQGKYGIFGIWDIDDADC